MVMDTFDDEVIKRNILKAVQQAMAELNRNVFSSIEDNAETETSNTIDIGNWVLVNGQLERLEDVTENLGGDPLILTPTEVIRQTNHYLSTFSRLQKASRIQPYRTHERKREGLRLSPPNGDSPKSRACLDSGD